jgi:hypothetical protein
MALRKRFLEIVGNWSQPTKIDLEDIPRKLKHVEEELNELTEEEHGMVAFMLDVQQAREHFHRKKQ